MMRNALTSVLVVTLLAAVISQTASCGSTGVRVVFKASNGKEIVLDTRTGTLRTPNSKAFTLSDCGNKFQTCMTNHHGFAFAYFRNCNDVDYKQLTFYPKVVSALHGNFWMVFDASPNYMFHYMIPKGIVGIYVGPTPSYDFRSLFKNPNLHLDKLDAMEYHITGSGTVAACSESE